MDKLIVRLAYWRQYAWFYLWKWTMPVSWLHRRTIRPVNDARFAYVDIWRRRWPKADREDAP